MIGFGLDGISLSLYWQFVMHPVTRGRFYLLLAALLFSTGGAVIKATTLNAWQVAFLRCGIAALVLFGLVPAARGGWEPLTLLTSTMYAATLILFVLANKLTTSANAIFLQDTAPLYLLLLGPWLLHESFHRRDLLLLAVLGLGMGMIVGAEQQPYRTAPDPQAGNLVALVSGITWALTLVGLRWAESHRSHGAGMVVVATGCLLAAIVCGPVAWPIVGATVQDWLLVSYLGVFQIGLAYILMTRGLRSVSAFEASLLLFAEPALNPIWTWLVHGERPAAMALAGGVLILSGTLVKALERRYG